MKNLSFLLLAEIFLLICLMLFTFSSPKPPYAKIDNHNFSLYLATTPKDRETGLAKFNKINVDQGMLFIFPEADYYSFWMKNMLFPIDIIFINQNKIVEIFENVPVSSKNPLPIYTGSTKANEVLEINAGLSKKYGLKKGDFATTVL